MDINNINKDYSTDEVKISPTSYQKLVSTSNSINEIFDRIVTTHKQLNKDIQWEGKTKEQYDTSKGFIDQFMTDLPDLFEIISKQVNDTELILNDLFSGVSQSVKRFENYGD